MFEVGDLLTAARLIGGHSSDGSVTPLALCFGLFDSRSFLELQAVDSFECGRGLRCRIR
jgi:hypothetical protein